MRGTDSPDAIYAGHGTPDIHQYVKRTPAGWMICVAAVILLHVAFIALLWIADLYESTRFEQDLAITLSDAGGQSSVVFIIDTVPGVAHDEPVAEVQPERRSEPMAPITPPSDPAPPQEHASLLMPAQEKVQESVIETKSPETPKSQEPPPVVQEPTPKPQEPPPVLQSKPVAKPVQSAPPTKKQPTAEKPNMQKGAAEQSTREDPSGSSQNSAPVSSEGSNTSTQAVPKLVKSPKPRYPSESIRLRQEGRVIVNIEVLESGAVGQATIAQSSGFSALDQSALEAVKNWQYASGSGGGQLVTQWVHAGIIFELKNR
jgi:protein TonB